METPIDVILKHLGPEGTTGLTAHQLGMNIDLELQRKFLHFNIAEEIANVDITDDVDGGVLTAGSGPEEARCSPNDNPLWLLNRAINTLALYWHLNEKEKAALIERRPAPGIYQAKGATYFIAIVTADHRVMVQQDNGGFRDLTNTWDNVADNGDGGPWTMQRIDLADGTIAP